MCFITPLVPAEQVFVGLAQVFDQVKAKSIKKQLFFYDAYRA